MLGKSTIIDRLTLMLSIPIFLVIWEAISRSEIVNSVLFPPPSLVAVALYKWAVDGSLFLDLGMSISRVVIGFISGALAGILIGILTGRYRFFSNLLTPLFQLLRPIPPIAFVPIVILWFGLSELGKWFLIFWGVFFTVWIAAHLGVQKVDETLIRAAQCLGTPDKKMLRQVLLPASMPYIFIGLRTAVSISFYTLVAAELAGTFSGIAYRIDIAQQNLQVGQTIGGLIILGIISAVADKGFGALSKRLVWWG
ncbi:MAG TPA: ABC transporter permease [Nodosilinea sp.]|nr:ABC transporter permease [Nodosilinea sp.]